MSNNPFIVRYIAFDTVKLLDQNGKFHQPVKTFEAQKMARDAGMDLVCFNVPEGNDLAFCKILDFNKWKYEAEKNKKKAEKEHRRRDKEMRFSPNIADNDIAHKMRQVNEFLDDGDDVTLTMRLKGRERLHFVEAENKMNFIVKMCEGHGKEITRKKTWDLIMIKLSKAAKVSQVVSSVPAAQPPSPISQPVQIMEKKDEADTGTTC